MLILSELYSTGPYRMRVHYLRPVLLQRRSQTFLLPPPPQTDWHSITPQILLQHIQLTTFLSIGEKADRTNRGIQMNRKARETEVRAKKEKKIWVIDSFEKVIKHSCEKQQEQLWVVSDIWWHGHSLSKSVSVLEHNQHSVWREGDGIIPQTLDFSQTLPGWTGPVSEQLWVWPLQTFPYSLLQNQSQPFASSVSGKTKLSQAFLFQVDLQTSTFDTQ